jgi:hypothetical protein
VVNLEQDQRLLLVGIEFELGGLDFYAGEHPLAVNAMAGAISLETIPEINP